MCTVVCGYNGQNGIRERTVLISQKLGNIRIRAFVSVFRLVFAFEIRRRLRLFLWGGLITLLVDVREAFVVVLVLVTNCFRIGEICMFAWNFYWSMKFWDCVVLWDEWVRIILCKDYMVFFKSSDIIFWSVFQLIYG